MFNLQASRSWRNDKAVALLAAAAFAVGIGAATAIYTIVNAVMLKPMPYRDGERFVAVLSAAVNDPEHYGSLSLRDAQTYQERTRVFDAFGWFRYAGQTLTFAGEPHHVESVAVTPPLARQLGVDPILGQWFQDDTGVVISAPLWRRLGTDPAIVGKPLVLDGRSYSVTGVMPDYFQLPVDGILSAAARTDVWIPLDPSGRGEPEGAGIYFAYARRRADVTFAIAEADVKRVAAEIVAEDPVNRPAYTARVFDLRTTVIKDIQPTLLLLLAAAALLFLITCANAAGLLLARSVARARETAMRVALGARRSQLASHYLAESLPIALVGAVAGIVMSFTLTPGAVSMVAEYLPRADEIAVDWTVALFAAGSAVLASLLSSLAPLWQAVRTAPVEAFGNGTRASAGPRSRLLSQGLVVGEIALACALLVVSAILISHLRNLSRTSAGLDADNVLTFVADSPTPIAVQSVNPALPIHHVASMREIIQRSMTLERVASVLTAFFALAALLLATLGVYGIVSYFVRHRRVEIGTRVALGATSRGVLSLIVSGGLMMAAIGVLAGGLLGFGASVYLARTFEIGNIGLVPFLAAIVIVAAVALGASAIPAWRASRLSPMVAIRD